MKNHVELSYTLDEKEILDGMKISGVYRTNGKKSLIQMILLVIVFGIFLVSFIMGRQIYNLLLAVFALIVVAVIYFMPLFDMKRHAKKGEKNVKIRIYSGKLYYYPKGESRMISIDDGNYVRYSKELKIISVVIKEGGILIIPLRAVPNDKKEAVFELLDIKI